MKLGLVADVHEHADLLKAALACFEREKVDLVVHLGDVFDLFQHHDHLEETCRLLREANAVGVWGNHDYDLCMTPAVELEERFGPVVSEFFTTLRPRLELEGCLMTHVEPWLDTEYMPNLWYFGRPDKNAEERERLFSETSHRVMFAGHYHRWMHVTPTTSLPISRSEIDLSDGRHFVVLGALCNGQLALYDTVTSGFRPMDCAAL
jgi:Icc-related predicted phosphoesterase